MNRGVKKRNEVKKESCAVMTKMYLVLSTFDVIQTSSDCYFAPIDHLSEKSANLDFIRFREALCYNQNLEPTEDRLLNSLCTCTSAQAKKRSEEADQAIITEYQVIDLETFTSSPDLTPVFDNENPSSNLIPEFHSLERCHSSADAASESHSSNMDFKGFEESLSCTAKNLMLARIEIKNLKKLRSSKQINSIWSWS
uniref:Uncharacterized protein n=1 Tax=Glossina brevipalpis TaxID=37001 RepID=A0A1A9WR13_9MUSC